MSDSDGIATFKAIINRAINNSVLLGTPRLSIARFLNDKSIELSYQQGSTDEKIFNPDYKKVDHKWLLI